MENANAVRTHKGLAKYHFKTMGFSPQWPGSTKSCFLYVGKGACSPHRSELVSDIYKWVLQLRITLSTLPFNFRLYRNNHDIPSAYVGYNIVQCNFSQILPSTPDALFKSTSFRNTFNFHLLNQNSQTRTLARPNFIRWVLQDVAVLEISHDVAQQCPLDSG